VCIATLLSLGSRLVSLFGYQKFIGEDDFSADYIDEGKALMKRERRLRERNIREHGKATPRDQLPFELLRESRVNTLYANARRNKPHPRPTPSPQEDQSVFGRFVSKAKRVTFKGKAAISARYHSARGRGKEDTLELLPHSGSAEEMSGRSSSSIGTRTSFREPPRDIFDDI